VAIRDVPRELARAATIVGTMGADIEKVEHQRAFTTLPAQNAQLEMVLQKRGPEHIEQVIKALRDAGLPSELDTY
jgi:threonine dehydratase